MVQLLLHLAPHTHSRTSHHLVMHWEALRVPMSCATEFQLMLDRRYAGRRGGGRQAPRMCVMLVFRMEHRRVSGGGLLLLVLFTLCLVSVVLHHKCQQTLFLHWLPGTCSRNA